MPETNETYQPMTFDAIRIGLGLFGKDSGMVPW